MNKRVTKIIFKQPKPNQKSHSLKLRTKHDDYMRHTYFRVSINDEQFNTFVNIIQAWRDGHNKPKFKVFIFIREQGHSGFRNYSNDETKEAICLVLEWTLIETLMTKG